MLYKDNFSKSDFYDKIIDKICDDLLKYTPQLFTVKDFFCNDTPNANSSSVLITYADEYFLITAGHNVDNIDLSNIGIMINNDFCTIGGTVKCFEPNDINNYVPQKSDIAIFKLSQETINAFKERYDFLPSNKIGIDHFSISSPYLIFGFPERKTKMDFTEKKIMPEPFIFRTIGVDENQYKQKEINSNKTLMLSVKQKKVMRSKTKLIEKLPKLHGISGCGVWHVFNFENPDYQLVSILTGENSEKSVLYSTRISIVINLIEKYFNIPSQQT